METLVQFLLRHGYGVLFVAVLVEQIGVPVPAVPVLLAVGALAGLGKLSLLTAWGLAILATLSSDSVWYALGRVKGHQILKVVCRLALEPDSCVTSSKEHFRRFGVGALIFSKFIPGLGTVATPMAGLTRVHPLKFGLFDAAGAGLWAGTYLGIGYLFRHQLQAAADAAMQFGSWFGGVLVAALLAYVGWKYFQRRRFLKKMALARVSPQEVKRMIDTGEGLTIIDLRSSTDVQAESFTIPGAVWIRMADLDARHHEIPRDRDIILYCS